MNGNIRANSFPLLTTTLSSKYKTPWQVKDGECGTKEKKLSISSLQQHYFPCFLKRAPQMMHSKTDGSDSKESDYNAGDPGSIPGSGRCPGEGNGNPFQYSFPENFMD